jgi:Mg2+-importing ATPase
VVLILRTRGAAWRSRPSTLLLWTTLGAGVFALTVPFLGSASRLFGFVPLSATEMATVVAIVATYLAATEITKRWFFRPGGPVLAPTTAASRLA